jgi:hypothetical protein
MRPSVPVTIDAERTRTCGSVKREGVVLVPSLGIIESMESFTVSAIEDRVSFATEPLSSFLEEPEKGHGIFGLGKCLGMCKREDVVDALSKPCAGDLDTRSGLAYRIGSRNLPSTFSKWKFIYIVTCPLHGGKPQLLEQFKLKYIIFLTPFLISSQLMVLHFLGSFQHMFYFQLQNYIWLECFCRIFFIVYGAAQATTPCYNIKRSKESLYSRFWDIFLV